MPSSPANTKTQIKKQLSSKQINNDLVARTECTLTEAATIRRAEITERGNAKRWSGTTKTQLGHATLPLLDSMRRLKIVGQRRRKLRSKNCHGRTNKSGRGPMQQCSWRRSTKKRTVHAEVETRAAALDVEAEGRKAQEARVASLEEEMGLCHGERTGRRNIFESGFPKRTDEKTHSPPPRLRRGGEHATGSRYHAYVIRDLER